MQLHIYLEYLNIRLECDCRCYQTLRLSDQFKGKSATGKKPARRPLVRARPPRRREAPCSRLIPRNLVSVRCRVVVSLGMLNSTWTAGQDIRPQPVSSNGPNTSASKGKRSFCTRVPSPIAQFSHTLDKNTATQLFKLLNESCPESKEGEKACLTAAAAFAYEEKGKDPKVRSFPSSFNHPFQSMT